MSTQEILELSGKYIMNTYGRLPMALVKGQGVQVWDAGGREYLDFVGGIAVNALGHCPPALVQAITRQAQILIHTSNLYHIEPQARLAQLLVENSCCDRAFFCNSGAEANEGAIKLARKYAKKKYGPEKFEIITALKSFHGRTLATITATGQAKFQKGFEPLPAGFKYVPFNDLAALEEAIGPHTCAVMLEPVQGEGGVNVPGPDYLKGVKDLCAKHNLLLIFDEVQSGMGRTGKLFAYQHDNVEPDIMTLAKALGGGFPIGAMLAKEEVALVFQPGDHASTFGGNPLASAAGIAVMETMLAEGFLDRVAVTALYFRKWLDVLAGKYNFIKEVRGLGFLVGMELDGARADGVGIVDRCREKGLLINCVGENILRFIPPLVVSRAEIDQAVEILDKVLAKSAG